MKKLFAIVSLALTAGCWTFNETEFPSVPAAKAPETGSPTVQLAGFAATVVRYDAIHSFQTVYVPGYCGRRYWSPGYVQTVPVTSYMPRTLGTDRYLRRARDDFEGAGFTLAAAAPDRIVEVDFEGPIITNGDLGLELAWEIFTVFFCDYGASKWTAKLRIRDGKTGKLLMSHVYEQPFETHVFGLIPLFGISASNATSIARQQDWCLSALTDRAVADATAYLARQ